MQRLADAHTSLPPPLADRLAARLPQPFVQCQRSGRARALRRRRERPVAECRAAWDTGRRTRADIARRQRVVLCAVPAQVCKGEKHALVWSVLLHAPPDSSAAGARLPANAGAPGRGQGRAAAGHRNVRKEHRHLRHQGASNQAMPGAGSCYQIQRTRACRKSCKEHEITHRVSARCVSVVVQAAERERLLELVARLEAGNPLPDPTQHLDLLAGSWRVLFSTITITVRPAPLVCLTGSGSWEQRMGVHGPAPGPAWAAGACFATVTAMSRAAESHMFCILLRAQRCASAAPAVL